MEVSVIMVAICGALSSDCFSFLERMEGVEMGQEGGGGQRAILRNS